MKFYIFLILFFSNILYSQEDTITVKEYKRLPALSITILSVLISENQYRLYEKYIDKYQEVDNTYERYLENPSLCHYPPGGRYGEDIVWIPNEELVHEWYENEGKEFKQKFKLRYKKYHKYFYISTAVSIGSFIYAIIPVKTKIPVSISVTPNNIDFSFRL